MRQHHWDLKQLRLSEDQIEHHKQTQCELQKLNHIAAQHVIRMCRLHDDVKECAQIVDDLSSVSDRMSLLMAGCEQIVAEGLRESPNKIIIRIRRRSDRTALKSSHVDDKGVTLAADPTLQLQTHALVLLISTATRSLIASNVLRSSTHMIKALQKLTRALIRQQDHFQNMGAVETEIEIRYDRELAGEIHQADAGTDHAKGSLRSPWTHPWEARR